MKYSRETLKKLKDLFDEFDGVSLEEFDQVRERAKSQGQNASLPEDQRSAAEQIPGLYDRVNNIKFRAREWSRRIGEYLAQEDDITNGWTEAELEEDIETIRQRVDDLAEQTDTYLIRENDDAAPDRNDKMWNFLPYTGKLKQAADRLGAVQASNEIDRYHEADQAFGDEMTYLTAMSLSNVDFDGPEVSLSNLNGELQNSRRELSKAQDELSNLENGRNSYQRQYEDAVRRESEYEKQYEKLQQDREVMKKQTDTAEKNLGKIEELQNEYTEKESRVQYLEKIANDAEIDLQDVTTRHRQAHNAAKNYDEILASVSTKRDNASESQREMLGAYAADKEAELRWGKAEKYTQELIDTVMNDDPQNSLVQSILFAKPYVREKKGFLGFGKREGQAGFPARYLQELEEKLNEPQKEKLAKARDLVARIQASMPDNEKARELMNKPLTKDPKKFTAELREKISAEHAAAQKKLESNPTYMYTKDLMDTRDKLNKTYEDLTAQMEHDENAKTEMGKDAYDKATDALAAEIAENNARILKNPLNSDMIDQTIAEHIEEEEKLAALDDELEEKTGIRNRTQENLKERKAELDDLRREAIRLADPTYQELRRTEDDVIREEKEKAAAQEAGRSKKNKKGKEQEEAGPQKKPSEERVEQLLAAEDMEGVKAFDRMKQTLQETIKTQNANLDATYDQASDLNRKIISAKNDKQEYSFTNYKKQLENKSIEVDRLQSKVSKLGAMKEHLDKAREKYNARAEHLTGAVNALDDTKKKILDRIGEFKEKFDKNKKPGHTNKSEYTELGKKLNEFTEESVANMSPAELKAKLGELGSLAEAYDTAKEKEWRPFPSSQRTFRRKFAKDISSFADSHSKTIDGMNIKDADWNIIKAAKTDPPAKITDEATFAAKADELKADYRDKVRKLNSFVGDIQNSYRQDPLHLSDEQRKEVITDAMVSQEMERKVFAYNPSYKTMGAHVLELGQEKENIRNDVKRRYQGMIDHFVGVSRTEEDKIDKDQMREDRRTTGRDIADRKRHYDAKQKYRNIKPYGPEAQNAPVQQNQQQRQQAGMGAM